MHSKLISNATIFCIKQDFKINFDKIVKYQRDNKIWNVVKDSTINRIILKLNKETRKYEI